MLIQNDVTERVIRIIKNLIRVMIKKAELLIEFWAEAAETDFYLRNRIVTELIINGKLIISEKAFTRTKSFINHIRV